MELFVSVGLGDKDGNREDEVSWLCRVYVGGEGNYESSWRKMGGRLKR